MRVLLAVLRNHETAIEADLQRFYGIDYRDRWRTDGQGRPRLTLRRIWVLCIRHMPPDGELARAINDGRTPWTRDQGLLDDLRIVIEAVNTDKKHKPKPHPDRPDATKQRSRRRAADPGRQRVLTDARRRARERRRAIEAGEIT